MFQNGFLSAIPFLLSYIIGVGGGQVADRLRYSHILTTGEVRKVFATAGEFKCPFISSHNGSHRGWGGGEGHYKAATVCQNLVFERITNFCGIFDGM